MLTQRTAFECVSTDIGSNGLEKAAEFPDAPLIFDLVSKEEDRQLIEMMVGPGAMARLLPGGSAIRGGPVTMRG